MNARHIGKNLRGGYAVVAVLLSLLVGSAVHSPVAGALGIPEIAHVTLPIGGTILDSVVSPLTEKTNDLLPVDVHSSSSTLGAQVDLLPGNNSASQTPTAAAALDAPIVPQVVNAITGETTRTPDTPPHSLSDNTATAATANGAEMAPGDRADGRQATPMPFSPVIFGVANFLGHGVPGTIQTLMSIGDGHAINVELLLVSLAVFILTIVALFGTIYLIDHTTLVPSSNGRLAQFAQAHDLAQITSVVIVMSGVILVVTFLIAQPFS